MEDKKKLDVSSILEQAEIVAQKASRYKVILFLLFVVLIYGFIVYRINSLNSVQPSDNAIAAQNNPIKAAHIDKSVVNQLESLRNNNVNVQTLFEQARNNPFQE